MPAARLNRRRRSSLGIALSTPVKPGTYGIATSPRNVTFAPNVTPGTYIEETEGVDDTTSEPTSPTDALFPPAEVPVPSSSRRRAPPGKRRSQGYIPRPPNAFMLFRANFVRQKHVPGSIETNHGSLSKIIGNCWKSLPETEKKVWELKAKKAKADHREQYPNYRFRPVHNKNKAKSKSKVPVEPADERRCEEVALLLLEGKKGEELAAAVRRLDFDRAREMTGSVSPMPMLHAPVPMAMPMSAPFYLHHRRSSSVPPPTSMYQHPIAIPSMNFFPHSQQEHCLSRPESPVSSIARSQQRMLYGQRRASSAEPRYYNDWTMSASLHPDDLRTEHEPLPDVVGDLFNPAFMNSEAGFSYHTPAPDFNFDPSGNPALALQIGPLDAFGADPMNDSVSSASTIYSVGTPADTLSNPWMHSHYDGHSPGDSPSAFSATPPPTEYAPSEASYGGQMHHVAIAGTDRMAPELEDLGVSFNTQMDMNYHPMDQAATMHMQDYSGCGIEQQTQLYGNPTGCVMDNQVYASFGGELHLSGEVIGY